jgi:excisionase family DNA binding protein
MNGTLTVEQAAKMLEVNPETIRRWLRKKQLAGSNPGGGKWLIPREAVVALMSIINPNSESETGGAAGPEANKTEALSRRTGGDSRPADPLTEEVKSNG